MRGRRTSSDEDHRRHDVAGSHDPVVWGNVPDAPEHDLVQVTVVITEPLVRPPGEH